MRGEFDRAYADRLAVLEPVVDARRRIIEEWKKREESEGPEGRTASTAGRNDVGIAVADPELGAGLVLQRRQRTGVVAARLRVDEHLHVGDVETELGDARHEERRGGRLAAGNQDIALGAGEQEGREVGRADVVQVAGDAERLGGRLALQVRLVFALTADEDDGNL